ncbi:unnamed protein product [Moneuplotes crassus]|uniref:Amino acid transporter transmembrane domain-containing protein n=1 Tax=Euplotes crassus TaxID=5936 RepID=A0AAD1U7L5_EUPCR|nr:unnamed protein product [Moneuplotes crassus]
MLLHSSTVNFNIESKALDATKVYDENEELVLNDIGKLSDIQTFFSLIRAYLVIGILVVPNGYFNGGWVFSNLCLLLSLLFTMGCSLLLLKISEKYPGSYSELGYLAFGAPGKFLCDLAIFASQIGFTFPYFVYIWDNVNLILVKFFEVSLDKWVICAVIFLIFTPLTWVKRIEWFIRWHIFADFLTIIVLGAIMVFGLIYYREEGFAGDVRPFNQDNYLVFIGTAVYMFEGTGLVLPMKNASQNKNNLPKILCIVLFFVFLLVCVFGTVNYLIYGDEVLSHTKLITQVLPDDSYTLLFIKVSFMICLTVTFPVAVYPPNMIIESYICKSDNVNDKPWSRNISRTLLVLGIITIACTFESGLDKLLSIVGSLTCTPVAFTLPAMMHLKLIAETTFSKALDMFLILVSLTLLVGITGYNLSNW